LLKRELEIYNTDYGGFEIRYTVIWEVHSVCSKLQKNFGTKLPKKSQILQIITPSPLTSISLLNIQKEKLDNATIVTSCHECKLI
jgi:hypothetical protein